LSEFRA
jgi:hypothetical protein